MLRMFLIRGHRLLLRRVPAWSPTPYFLQDVPKSRLNGISLLGTHRALHASFVSLDAQEELQEGKTASSNSKSRLQLERLGEMIHNVGATNRPPVKARILAEYSDLRPVLGRIMDSHYTLNMTAKGLRSYINSQPSMSTEPTLDPQVDGSNRTTTMSLEDLLDHLNSKSVTGHQAMELVQEFMHASGLDVEKIRNGDGGRTSLGNGLMLEEVFERVLDKNLKAGFSLKTLSTVEWNTCASAGNRSLPSQAPNKSVSSTLQSRIEATSPTSTSPPESSSHNLSSSRSGQATLPSKEEWQSPLLHDNPIAEFPCALGKTILRHDLDKLFPSKQNSQAKDGAEWYASRKLDGVRVLTLVDVLIPTHPGQGKTEVLGVQTLSRNGKSFTTLDKLKQEITRAFPDFDQLNQIIGVDEKSVIAHLREGTVRRIVLDGECCQLVDTHSEFEDDRFKEDFGGIVRLMRRKHLTIENPLLFLFDVINWSDFTQKNGKGKSFSQRLEDCRAILDRVKKIHPGTGEKQTCTVIRPLEQKVVKSVEEVEQMVAEAAEHGWEGLIIRRDLPYEGKRS